MTKKPPRGARLYQHVAERLTRAIASGTYKPGDRLPAERDLALANGVSRPTVREAIIALELDGLVEVRIGSGVYVLQSVKLGSAGHIDMDVGAFELTEARLLIEGETAALAASQITEEELTELEGLLDQMEEANRKSATHGELVDRRFHEAIARATRNGALAQTVEQLWTIRSRSPQCIRLLEKSRAIGTVPVISEHRAILTALHAHDPNAARAAMRDHLNRVLDYLLDATEVEAVEEVKARAAAQRARFGAAGRG